MNKELLKKTAEALVATGKGILAADESNGTMGKRLASIGMPNEESYRQGWRQTVFTTPNLGNYISGIILFDETLRQSTTDGQKFTDTLKSQNIIPGIKVDAGLIAFGEGENVTEGLEGLADRLAEYAEMGAGFAKWRALINITDTNPTQKCVDENAKRLAEYAWLCQEAGIVPIVEPEVLMDGDHTFERCKEATLQTFASVFNALEERGVYFEGMLLKPSMVVSGASCVTQATADEVAKATVEVLNATVNENTAGIVFLSGGQSDEDATMHLNLMNQMGVTPWPLSFSYGRALQAAGLQAWGGKSENVAAAQRVLALRSKCNGAAATGKYSESMEAA
jgi:fructose-bisphosphate aldolase class I